MIHALFLKLRESFLILIFLDLRYSSQTSLKLADLNISWSPIQFTNFFGTSWYRYFLIPAIIHKLLWNFLSKHFLISATVHKLLWNFLSRHCLISATVYKLLWSWVSNPSKKETLFFQEIKLVFQYFLVPQDNPQL